jgi:spermidine synthase
VLLGTFMGGMCAGSLLLPRVLSFDRHPLRVYAALELGIGLMGIAVLMAMPILNSVYATIGGHGPGGVPMRGLVAGLCLLPPTVLMGATLPAAARWVESTREGVAWLGLFYGGNIAGAVFGCLFAGFYLLRVHDMVAATIVAALINLVVAAVAVGLARQAPHSPRRPEAGAGRTVPAPGSWAVYVVIALSGASALGAEVIWIRVLSLILGTTVYTFSLILAVFLVGLGLGSSGGSFLVRSIRRPRLALGWCQLLLAAGIAWTAWSLTRFLPYWPVIPWLSPSPWMTFQVDLVRCAFALLPPAVLWGASFPLALAAAASPGDDTGRLVGGLYAANTMGAIAGATGFSLVILGSLGTRGGEQLLMGMVLAGALLMLLTPAGRGSAAASGIGIKGGRAIARSALAAACLVAGLLAWRLPEVPPGVVGYGRFLPHIASLGLPEFLYVGEGLNASIAVSVFPDGTRNFHVSGKVEASTDIEDMRLQRMLGHLPALANPSPRSVLVVGFGTGVTAGSFLTYPGVERVVIVEIEPLIPRVVGPYFAAENYGVLTDPRVEIVHDDARHYLLTTDETFDIITSDPIHPWVKGSAALYTKEYFELVKRRLRPEGVVAQWVPLYESTFEVVQSEFATFFDAFPMGTAWSNHARTDASPTGVVGYDVVLLAKAGPMSFDVGGLQARLDRPDHDLAAASLRDVGIIGAHSVADVFATYLGRDPDLQEWLAGAEINRDRNLRLQFLAGLALDSHQEVRIFDAILSYRRFPSELFLASDAEMQWLMALLGN